MYGMSATPRGTDKRMEAATRYCAAGIIGYQLNVGGLVSPKVLPLLLLLTRVCGAFPKQ